MNAKDLYHRLVPDRVRYPIGRLRRGAIDRWMRWRHDGPPLPPAARLRSVQMTPWIWEYLDVGRVAAGSVRAAFEGAGLRSASDVAEADGSRHRGGHGTPVVLDFGCGLCRTLRFLLDAGWRLHGADVDADSVAWSRGAFPGVRFEVNGALPPLPYGAASFDGLFAVSVFTHFDRAEQHAWAAEVARVLRQGALAVITTMGPHALTGFENLCTESNRSTLGREGFFFDDGSIVGDGRFNSRGAFHTRDGLERIFGSEFELLEHRSGGVDGFQDLSVLRRRSGRGDLVDSDLVDREPADT